MPLALLSRSSRCRTLPRQVSCRHVVTYYLVRFMTAEWPGNLEAYHEDSP